MSLGTTEYSQTLLNAINYANNSGTLIITAAGNCGDPETLISNGCAYLNQIDYPANYPNVLAVGSTDQNDNRAHDSTYGPHVDVSAPGVDIYSTIWDDSYDYKSGTSMATPLVSGLAALIWAKNSNLTNYQVKNIIVGTADDLGLSGRDDYFGYGRINTAKAVANATSGYDFMLKEKVITPIISNGQGSQFEPGAILVGFKKVLSSSEKIGLIDQLNLKVVDHIEILDVLKVKVDPGSELSTIQKLKENFYIEFAEPNYMTHLIK